MFFLALAGPTIRPVARNTHTDVDATPVPPEGVQTGAREPLAEEYEIAFAAYRALWHDSKPHALDLKVWCLLAQEPDLGVVRIATMLEVDRRTIGRAINRLVDAGLVERLDQSHDQLTGNFKVVGHNTFAPRKSAIKVGPRPTL